MFLNLRWPSINNSCAQIIISTDISIFSSLHGSNRKAENVLSKTSLQDYFQKINELNDEIWFILNAGQYQSYLLNGNGNPNILCLFSLDFVTIICTQEKINNNKKRIWQCNGSGSNQILLTFIFQNQLASHDNILKLTLVSVAQWPIWANFKASYSYFLKDFELIYLLNHEF